MEVIVKFNMAPECHEEDIAQVAVNSQGVLRGLCEFRNFLRRKVKHGEADISVYTEVLSEFDDAMEDILHLL